MKLDMNGIRSCAIFTLLTGIQGCAFHEEAFDILYIEPKNVPNSYILDNQELWPHVNEAWRQEHDFLAFEVITREQTNIHRIYEMRPPVALMVKDCEKEIPSIYQPGTRFIGRTPAANFKYETVIEYRRKADGTGRSHYDLFEKPAELCFNIQTLDMPFIMRGDTYRLQLNETIKRIADGQ